MDDIASDSTIARHWLDLPPPLESMTNKSSDTLLSDSTTTPFSTDASKKSSPDATSDFKRPIDASEYYPFITLTGTGSTLSESIGNTSNSTPITSPSQTIPPSTLSTKSPTYSNVGFFSNFRSSSPKIQLPNATSSSSTLTSRDELIGLYSASTLGRKGAIDRERDISQTGSDQSSRNRRPSSVFEHVRGSLDRFGRRLQSRGELERRRMSNSVNGLNDSAVDVGESGSSVDDLSPNESSSHMSPTTNQPPIWERSTGDRGPGLSWSPIVDEGQHSRPEMMRNTSVGSSNGEGSSSRLGSHSMLQRGAVTRVSVMERTLVQVTEDNERFSVVDISGLNSAAAIKERMMSKLHRFEEDSSCFAMARTEIGMSGPGGPTLDNDELLALCWQEGDERGSLKFLLQQVSPSTHPNHSMLPPPRYSNPTSLLGLQESGTAPAPASHNQATTHSKSGSFSSRSSTGDVLNNHGDVPAMTGDSGSEASGRIGTLHRTRATSRRANGASSVASNDETKSPITSTRSPSQPSTPLLPSVLELKAIERDSTPHSNAKRSYRPDSLEKRQSLPESPIEELNDSTLRSAGVRRSANGNAITRPTSSHAVIRTHNQHEGDAGQRNSQGSSSAAYSPKLGKSDIPERRVSDKTPSQLQSRSGEDRISGNSQLPKSLQPGGRDPRGIDAADAAHMYLGGSSSPLDEPNREMNDHRRHQVQAVHNVRSVDDMQRRLRASMMSSLQEMPILNREQLNSGGGSRQGGNPSAAAIIRQGSADANMGHRPHPPYAQHDPRDPRFNSTTGMIARPRTSNGPERERAVSYAESPYHHSMNMVGRPIPMTSPARPGMMAQPSTLRPMTSSGSIGPIHHMPPNQASFRPLQPFNEFGARIPMPHPQSNQMHHPSQYAPMHDPRQISSLSSPARPLTFQDQQRFRPFQLPPGYVRPPSQHQQQQHREESFIPNQFPASNPRTVSEFQRNPSSALQPGMTVQETMQRQRQLAMAMPQSTQQLRGVDPRETHSMSARPMYASRPSPHLSSTLPSRPPFQQQQQYIQPSNAERSQVPNRQQMPAVSMSRPANKNPPIAAPLARPHTAALDEWNSPPTERSSGSSFATASSSHKRNLSSEDRHHAGWVEEVYSAPTSARSSRSESLEKDAKMQAATGTSRAKPSSAETHSELPYTDLVAQEVQRRRSMPEDDLSNVRPLPKLPPLLIAGGKLDSAKSAGAIEGRNEDEDTIRAAEWRLMLMSLGANAENGEDSGTAKAIKHERSNQSEASKAESTGARLAIETTPGVAAEEDGTFASFDEEEEYDEGGTWAQPLDKLPMTPMRAAAQNVSTLAEDGPITIRPGASIVAGPRSPNSPHSPRTRSPRRPVLTLNIEPSVHGSPSLVEAVSPKSVSTKLSNHLRPSSSSRDSPQASNTLATVSPSSNELSRRTSFARRELDWAFRPPAEQLYENLDAFFPKHDLDKPVLDNAAPMSPYAVSPKAEVPTSSPAPLSSNRSRFTHKKSIRIVAQDRKKFLDRTDASERRQTEEEGLNRKRSTKLWGTKVVEVTPGASSSSTTSTDSPSTDAGFKPVFKWVKGDLIGKGTYGRVYLALNATTGEMIAVKQVELPMTDSDREDARQKGVVSALKSEIETLKDLDHPNIVSYLGFEETTSYLSIFLEYVPGGSVGSCLRKHGKLDEATIKSFLQQILIGLNYLHKRGILHRDLKADNLLVDFNGVVKISDFGTVRKSEDIYGNIASMSIQGSIFWMAPEVVSLSRAGYSAKVDIWSLGCVVLEMFAGRRPWSDEEAVQAMFKIGAERKPPPIPPDAILSRPATHFLKVCFAVDPASRPTAQRLLEHVFPHPEPGWEFSQSSLYKALHR